MAEYRASDVYPYKHWSFNPLVTCPPIMNDNYRLSFILHRLPGQPGDTTDRVSCT